MRKVLALTTVVVALVATTAVAQEAVEIKLDTPKVGDKTKTTVDETSDSKFVLTANGKDMAKTEKKTKALVYVDKVLAVASGARKPTKLERTYEKAVVTTDGKETTISLEKKTVLIEKKGDKYSFTVDGKEVEKDAIAVLEAEFNKSEKEDTRDLFFPKKAVKPGETWKIDSDALAKGLGDNKDFKIDASKLEASGKLVKAYKQDDKQFGVLEIKISAPITDLGPKLPIKISKGDFSVTLNGDGVIDGTSAQGKSTMVMKFTVNGGAEGVDVKIDATVTENRNTVPVK